MLKVTTLAKEILPCLYILMSSAYIPKGVDPVQRPKIKGLLGVGRKDLMQYAT